MDVAARSRDFVMRLHGRGATGRAVDKVVDAPQPSRYGRQVGPAVTT